MPDIDWVTARANCSLFEVFHQLRKSVEDDVAARVKLLGEGVVNMTFKMREDGDPKNFGVLRFSHDGPDSVDFQCSESAILVKDSSGKVKIEARLTLNDEGQCRLKIQNKEIESWQFRRRALEDFFKF